MLTSPPDKRRQGRRNREKGIEAEREFCALLRPVYPDAGRSTQWRGAKQEGCDVEGTPWWVEVRRKHAHGCLQHLKGAEAEAAARQDGRPVLVRLREDGDTRGAVLLREDVFLDLLRQAEGRI